ncbi:MAG TPA: RNA polymerase sigma factor [Acidobacteriota bacterium]|jgi:RNA polymerase sigma-70 factor (ECF subfamily)
MDFQEQRSDEDLMREIEAGSEQAFVQLYRRRQPGIYQFALRMSASTLIAEDIVQEVFMTLVREPLRYDRERGPVVAYLYGIARNQILRSLNRNRNKVSVVEGDAAQSCSESLVSTDDPLGDLTRSETIDAVRRAVMALPQHYREVVVLCDLNSLSYAEAATVLECAIGTVRSRLHRAHAQLSQKLRGAGKTASLSEKLATVRCSV